MGNLLNFVITWALTKQAQGELHLRIDDNDMQRSRDEFIQDILETLQWLGFSWDKFLPLQSKQRELYWSRLQQIPHYVCDCSRKQIEERGVETYDGYCRSRSIKHSSGLTQIRLLADTFQDDIVLWTKDNSASYHLASVVDDINAGVNLIVRGQDLKESTRVQLVLASKLGIYGNSFKDIKFYHHRLITGERGTKLSKTNQDVSLKAMRLSGRSVESIYVELGQLMGLENKTLSLEDFADVNFEEVKGLEIYPIPSKN